jgi:hypothetical protein
MLTLLRAARPEQNFQTVHTYCFNPKSISMGELYGNYNLMTNEWTDGLGRCVPVWRVSGPEAVEALCAGVACLRARGRGRCVPGWCVSGPRPWQH